jgi:ParB family chromosome partitioning protein
MATKTDKSGANFDALFGARQSEKIVSGGFKMLAHDRISVRPQVRQTFSLLELEELRASVHELREQGQGIEGSGVLQALLVCPAEGGYRLIAGEKRFRATQEEGLAQIPCVVVAAPKAEGTVRLLQLTENALRSAPPVLEEARAIKETMDEQNLSLRDMARLLGKTLGYVSNRTALLKMGGDVQAMVSARGDTLRVAAHIEKVADAALRSELIRAVVDEGIGEREVLRRVEAAQTGENDDEVFSRENTSSDGDGASSGGGVSDEVFSRENTSGGNGASFSQGDDGAGYSGAPSLRGVLRATGDAIERFRRAILSEEERQKARDGRDALQAMIEELNEILG